jgi:hypothetical protein
VSDIQFTDNTGNPIPGVTPNPNLTSSLLKYLLSDVIQIQPGVDFIGLKDQPLSQAAANPIQFQSAFQHKFQLGNTKPEIDVTPSSQQTLSANAKAGSNLFDSDPFKVAATVPANTGYVSLSFQGALDLGVSGSDGDLTFGFDANQSATLQFLKAFDLGTKPTLGEAAADTLAGFVIPADIDDLKKLQTNDIAVVSGQGSLKISGGIAAKFSPNPLASAGIEGIGTVTVQESASAGLKASFTLTGSWQTRARCTAPNTIELSFLRDAGKSLVVDLSAQAGVTVMRGDDDLLSELIASISRDPLADKSKLSGLQPSELSRLTDAIKGGLDHSFKASVDAALSASEDNQVLFQYQIDLNRIGADASRAIHRALDGDLTALTEMESTMRLGGVLADGLVMLNSVLDRTNKRGVTFRFNLIGLLNFTSLSELIANSEVVTDGVTGDVTIKETVTGNRISAMVLPQAQEALRKAMFDSLLITSAYRASGAVPGLTLSSSQVHFVFHATTNAQTIAQYLRWMVALNLLDQAGGRELLDDFILAADSSCILRTSFADADCRNLFSGNADYLDLGRRAMIAILDPSQDIDQFRLRALSEPLFSQLVAIGPNPQIAPVLGIDAGDNLRLSIVTGDLFTILTWVDAMKQAVTAVADMRAFLGPRDPASLLQDNTFKKKASTLRSAMKAVVSNTRTSFGQPWGMIALYWAAGSPATRTGSIDAGAFQVQNPPLALAAPAA